MNSSVNRRSTSTFTEATCNGETVSAEIKTIVAYVPYAWDHAVTTLRIVRPLELAGIELIQGNVFSDAHPEYVSQADAVLIQREFPASLDIYEQVIERARAEGKPVIYEIDDLLLELPEDHPDRAIDYYTPTLFPILRAIVEADLVTTTTAPMQAYLLPYNPNTWVLPNYLDEHTWQLPLPTRAANDLPDGHVQTVTIGYIGSNTHQPDLETIAPALAELLNKYNQASRPQVRLRLFGVQTPNILLQFDQVASEPLAIRSYQEYAHFCTQLILPPQSLDILIAPLNASTFNQCKSPVKFFEYSALGIPGVYSRITPYENVIAHGRNGYLAGAIEEWVASLSALIENPDLRRALASQALQDIQERWLYSQHAQEWREMCQRALQAASLQSAQQNKSEYTRDEIYRRTFVRVANQMHAWQTRLAGQLVEKDQQILALQAELKSPQRPSGLARKIRAWLRTSARKIGL